MSWVKLDSDDSIRLYRLCEGCVKTVQIWGSGEVTKDPDIVVLWQVASKKFTLETCNFYTLSGQFSPWSALSQIYQ